MEKTDETDITDDTDDTDGTNDMTDPENTDQKKWYRKAGIGWNKLDRFKQIWIGLHLFE